MDMATTATAVSPASHERQAERADELFALTEARYRRSVSRQERAEARAREAETEEERQRQMHLALVHSDAALCHQRAAAVFSAHRDHEREHADR
jgi:hypothetical protein